MEKLLGFNVMDIAVVAIIAAFVMISAKRGLIKSLVGVGSNIFALILSRVLYPMATKFILTTPIYDKLKESIIKELGIGEVLSSQTQKFEADMINSLGLPEMFKVGLLENNNSEVYNFLNVSRIEDYIGGYIAMLVINIFIFVLVFLVVNVGLKVLFNSLDIISKLPIIKTANKLGGAALGFFEAVLLIWVITAFTTLFLTQPSFSFISEGIENSLIAIKLYESNIILKMINKIIM